MYLSLLLCLMCLPVILLCESHMKVFVSCRTDWLYSQKYDRQNASIKRSIERSASRLVSGFNDESNV